MNNFHQARSYQEPTVFSTSAGHSGGRMAMAVAPARLTFRTNICPGGSPWPPEFFFDDIAACGYVEAAPAVPSPTCHNS